MIFDGTKIYFERKVEMAATQNGKPKQNGAGDRLQMKSMSEGLSVELSQPINFADLSNDKQSRDGGPEAEIRELIFVSEIPKSKRAFQLAAHESTPQTKSPNIVVENRTFDGKGTLIQKQSIVVPNATFNVGEERRTDVHPSQFRWRNQHPSRSEGNDGLGQRTNNLLSD